MNSHSFRFNIISLIILLLVHLLLFSCSQSKEKISIADHPPESTIVLENGSRPPRFRNVMKTANIDPACIQCNSQNRYSPQLKPFSKVSARILRSKLAPFLLKTQDAEFRHNLQEILEDHVMWAMVRGVLIEGNNNNLGAIILKGYFWTDENGIKHPLTIFRTAFTPIPGSDNSCYSSLLKKGNVKHVINLYDGEMNLNDLVKGEQMRAGEFNASYSRTAEADYGKWRDMLRRYEKGSPEWIEASKNVGRLIREQILKPQGNIPRGNILIHCGGGMHRTGMIIGILMRIINKSPRQLIIDTYKYHSGFRNAKNIGGFEQGNLDFIFSFDPKYLK